MKITTQTFFCCLIWNVELYMRGRERKGRRRDRERKRLQRSGVWHAEVGSFLHVSLCAGIQVLEPLPVAFPGALEGSWVWSAAASTQSSIHMGRQAWRSRLNLLYLTGWPLKPIFFMWCSFLSDSISMLNKVQVFLKSSSSSGLPWLSSG